MLGFSNTAVVDPRFDSNNQTLMSGGASGNVFAILNTGQFTNDETNANSFALIAGFIDQDTIELGASFHANGEPTGSNGFANVTTSGNAYKLVNFTQFSDTGTGDTFSGALGAITAQTLIRTTTAANSDLYASTGTNDRAEGAVDLTEFVGSSTNDGFITYQAGSRTFRQFQLKFIVNNSSLMNLTLQLINLDII